GSWQPAESCRDDEVCATESMGNQNQASCLKTVDVCRNRSGRSACDAAGTLYQCGENGVIKSMMRCGSVELCEPGLNAGTCAKCVPGTARCSGSTLEKCDTAGSGFYENMRCASPEACRANEGKCAEPICNPGQTTCMGDTLQRCRQDRTGFEKVRDCEKGQCDANAGACRACMPGTKRCNGNTLLTCDSAGMREESMNCAARCDKDRCVECVGEEVAQCTVNNNNGQNQCTSGSKRCRDGRWSECEVVMVSTPETCNGKDDNCDGMVDNDVVDCPQNQVCLTSGKCGCRDNRGCQQGQFCSEGTCIPPYTPSNGSCPQGMRNNHELCVPECGGQCPGAPGFNGMARCGRDVDAGDGCVLVCKGGGLNYTASCPQGLSCREVDDEVSICAK
ncbi:MAG TPA: hypothetical protein VJR89_33795, partial [Polyangiales bacterium]|nr:hypothetical protein [Polyangiales bacterium]